MDEPGRLHANGNSRLFSRSAAQGTLAAKGNAAAEGVTAEGCAVSFLPQSSFFLAPTDTCIWPLGPYAICWTAALQQSCQHCDVLPHDAQPCRGLTKVYTGLPGTFCRQSVPRALKPLDDPSTGQNAWEDLTICADRTREQRLLTSILGLSSYCLATTPSPVGSRLHIK